MSKTNCSRSTLRTNDWVFPLIAQRLERRCSKTEDPACHPHETKGGLKEGYHDGGRITTLNTFLSRSRVFALVSLKVYFLRKCENNNLLLRFFRSFYSQKILQKKKNYHWGNFCFKLKDILVLFIPLVLRRVNLITQLTFDTGQFFLLINENNADKLPNKFKSSVF